MQLESSSRRWQTQGGGALLVVLAFAVGWLLRDCQPPPTAAVPEPTTCPPVPEPVVCEPCGPREEPAPQAAARAPRRTVRRLPSLPARDEDADRRMLLAWAERESPDLRSCVPGGSLRVTVRVQVNDAGEVVRAALHPSGAELEPDARACLEARLRTWRLPEALRTGARELVFALRL